MRQDDPSSLTQTFWATYISNGRRLLPALHTVVWHLFYLSGFFLLISTIAGFGVPLLLNALLDAVSSEVWKQQRRA